MNKIWVIGMGPGHPDYMLPIAMKKLNQADRVYAGRRHLESFDIKGEKVQLKMPLSETLEDIKKHFEKEQVAVLVSGDTGFYSFLETLKGAFSIDLLETYPGISSLQYLFSRLNLSYQEAFIGSVHGRKGQLDLAIEYQLAGLLTDMVMNPNEIVKYLKSKHINGVIHIGENLSYEDECITSTSISTYEERTYSNLCVVVIERD